MKRQNSKIPRKFCIITTQRTGSAWLCQLLDSHPNVKASRELFIGEKHNSEWEDKDLAPFYQFSKSYSGNSPQLVFQYLDLLNSFSKEYEAIGFKVMYNQLRLKPEILLKFILDGFKVIHLVRENHLDVILSRENVWGRGRQGIAHTKTEIKVSPIYLDPSSLLRSISQQEFEVNSARLVLKILPNPVLEIAYESLCDRSNQVLNSIVDFLGVQNPEVSYRSELKKMNRGGYRNKIANYEEIKTLLAGTKFESLITET